MWYDEFIQECQAALDEDKIDSLLDRGVSREQVSLFNLGYVQKISQPELEPWARTYGVEDVFVFPATNAIGEVCGLQFRSPDKSKKGWQKFFWQKTDAAAFGLAQAMPWIWETKTVVLVEGNFDLFPIQRFVPNVISVMTVHISTKLWRFLTRIANRLVFAYDCDAAGKSAVEQYTRSAMGLNLSATSISPKCAFESVKDFSEFWEKYGDSGISSFFEKYLV